MPERYSAEEVDPSILGESITFPFSGKTAPNRFMKAPMTERLCSWSNTDPRARGVPDDRYINLYKNWGEGQIGCIISGNIIVDYENLEAAGNPILAEDHDGRLQKFKEVAKAAKAHGSLLVGQISHAGRQVEDTIQPYPVSASDVQLKETMGMSFAKPTPLTEAGIKDVVNKFATTAELMHKAGFDGIQLHGAHGYLIAQFLANTTNKRTDKYGGSLENRSRIIFEIIDEIKRRITDPSFILSIKLNSVEFQSGGFETSECAALCQSLEAAGVDFIDLSGGTYEELAFEHKRESTKKREAFFLEFADEIRPLLKKTIIYVTGGFRTVPAMVHAVSSGSCHGIGLGRPLTAEPFLCRDILSGSVNACLNNKLPSDMGMQIVGAGSQITEIAAGKEPFDSSDEKVVERFLEECGKAFAAMAEQKEKTAGFPVFEYGGVTGGQVPGYAAAEVANN
ncbi:FMN-linked oxidoreductase [Saitoella complicata NRRL Y-17804]|uniref:NADH:flavin oxidoreductase/NADH oxidase N-terminal domain-containing protein n=1 Tax=Saitoella complicata (strain BCRC 22490 / CBS 7301 / JCM 7358 / NBRC 10748 / NRRL Y-17804) TaxID=698492 RepID=A0A0E9NCC6_SAICN|nr:FMN-linked oxidoreductase [Saitoella complicata NRRL Y-17804]ODQ52668.1 FMN-linked oxidoreductase [Saitoella complicata NRRL Y-17804]GAO47484.1 hypothetical protein G7K_1690-t1 [Saitoella complicata NRRL Y-17804]